MTDAPRIADTPPPTIAEMSKTHPECSRRTTVDVAGTPVSIGSQNNNESDSMSFARYNRTAPGCMQSMESKMTDAYDRSGPLSPSQIYTPEYLLRQDHFPPNRHAIIGNPSATTRPHRRSSLPSMSSRRSDTKRAVIKRRVLAHGGFFPGGHLI